MDRDTVGVCCVRAGVWRYNDPLGLRIYLIYSRPHVTKTKQVCEASCFGFFLGLT